MAENSGMIPKNNLLSNKKISHATALGISLLGLMPRDYIGKAT